jgi:GNAT superfamily N-acetyltransferase
MDRRGDLAADLNRALVWRACAGSRQEIPGGWSTHLPAAPLVHQVNTVRLRERPPDGDLAAVANRHQSGLAFRHVAIEQDLPDEPPGWTRDAVVVMVRDGAAPIPPGAPPVDVLAQEVDEETLVALERRIYLDQGADADLARQLSVAQAAMRSATECRRFAAGHDPEPAAMATLFLDRRTGVGLVESVGTLRMWREQGLGGAVMAAALRAARDADLAVVGVVAGAEDWPQVWYANLGFAPVRRHVAYLRDSAGGRV